MTQSPITKEPRTEIVVVYPVTAADIEARREEYALIAFDTPVGYATGVKAIAHCRGTRVAIENRRVELNVEPLALCKAINSTAKELTAIVEDLEKPLREKREAVDAEKHRIKLEAEAAKKAIVEAELRAKLEAEEALRQAERVAERARMDAEREALAAERAALEEIQRKADVAAAQERSRLLEEKRAQDAAVALEREKMQEERRRIEAEHMQLENERRAREREAQAAKEAEEQQIAELERRAEAARRLAAIQPDLVKFKAFAAVIRGLERPVVGEASQATLTHVNALLDRVARLLEGAS
jgi:hypothetical protein